MEEYKLGRFSFNTLEEYNAAKHEVAIIKTLKDKSDLSDPKIKEVILTSFQPQTIIGKTFVNNLQKNTEPALSENAIPRSKPKTEIEPRSEEKPSIVESVRTNKIDWDTVRNAEKDDSNESDEVTNYHPRRKTSKWKLVLPFLFISATLAIILPIAWKTKNEILACIVVANIMCLFLYPTVCILITRFENSRVNGMTQNQAPIYQNQIAASNSNPTTDRSRDRATKALMIMGKLAADYAVGKAFLDKTQPLRDAILPSYDSNRERYARYEQAQKDAIKSARSLTQTSRKVGKYEVITYANGNKKVMDGITTVGQYYAYQNKTINRFGREVGKGDHLDSLMKK